MKFSALFIVSLVFWFSDAKEAKTNCTKALVAAETALKEVFFLGSIGVPTNVPQMENFGRVAQNASKVMKSYKSCEKGLGKQLYGMLSNDISKYVKSLFGKKSNLSQSVNEMRCLRSPVLKDVHLEVFKLSGRLNYISKLTTEKDLFPFLCCSLRDSIEGAISAVSTNCVDGKADAAKFVRNMFNSIVGDILDFACTKQPTIKVCDEQFPKVMQSLRNVPFTNGVDVNNGFLIKPFLGTAKKLSE